MQAAFTAQNVARHVAALVGDGEVRSSMVAGLAEVRAELRGEGVPAAERAAKAVLDVASL